MKSLHHSTMRLRSIIAILFSVLHMSANAAPGQPSEAERVFVQQMTFVHRVLVDFCVESAPESGPALEHHLGDVKVRMSAASNPVLDRLRAEGAFDRKVSPQDYAALDQMKAGMLAEMAKVEPDAYCRQLVTKLCTLDAQAMVNAAEQTYLKYLAAAKARPQPMP